MMRVWVINSQDLRDALGKVNERVHLTTGQWQAILGLKMRLKEAWIVERRGALHAALRDSGLPGPLRSMIRGKFEGKDFSDEELASEVTAARESLAKASAEAAPNGPAKEAEHVMIPNSEVRNPGTGREIEAEIVEEVRHSAAFRDSGSE